MDISRKFEKISLNGNMEKDFVMLFRDINLQEKVEMKSVNTHQRSTPKCKLIKKQEDKKDLFPKRSQKTSFKPSRLKAIKKSKLFILKGMKFCKYCNEPFKHKTDLNAHLKSSHAQLLIIEEIARKSLKGILPMHLLPLNSVMYDYSRIR